MNMNSYRGIGAPTGFVNFNFGPQIIATFGSARLVRHLDGHHDLLGGTPADITDAREWCSLFAPEVVFSTGQATRALIRQS